MFFLDKLRDMKFYSNKRFLFTYISKRERKKGNLYLLAGMDVDESLSILNSKSIVNTYNNSYYMERMVNLQVNFFVKKSRVVQKNKYGHIKANAPNIMRTYFNLRQYRGLNLYYDLYPQNKAIFNSAFSKNKKVMAFKEFLLPILNREELAKYKNKYIIFPFSCLDLEDNTKDVKQCYLANKANTPLAALYYMLYQDSESLKEFGDVTFIVMNEASNSFFKFTAESLQKKNLSLFISFLNLMRKLENRGKLTKQELSMLREQDKDKDKEVDESEETSKRNPFKVIKRKSKDETPSDDKGKSIEDKSEKEEVKKDRKIKIAREYKDVKKEKKPAYDDVFNFDEYNTDADEKNMENLDNILNRFDNDIEKLEKLKPVISKIKDKFASNDSRRSLTGDTSVPKSKKDKELKDDPLLDLNIDITEKESKKAEKLDKEVTKLDDKIDKELAKIAEAMQEEKQAKLRTNKGTKRNELLRKEHNELYIEDFDKSLEEIFNEIDEFDKKALQIEEIENVRVKNESLKRSTLANFESSYNKNQNEKDKLAIFASFADPKNEIPMYIRDIKKEDTSDSFNKKETWTVHYEDVNRKRHTIKIDIPVFVNDKFIYLNESKKSISKQLTLIPIVKTGTDEVQVVSNYNKIFINRYGSKISPKIERLRKFLAETKSKKIIVLLGNNTRINNDYLTTIEYDELASTFMIIDINKELSVFFNQELLRQEIEERGISLKKLKKNELPIGFRKDKLLILDTSTGLVKGENSDISNLIIDEISRLDSTAKNLLEKVSVSKRYVYSRVSILGRKVPLILLLGFREGLLEVMKRAKIKYEFSDKRRRLTIDEKNKIGTIQFSDGFLYFDLYPFSNSLLLNALYELPTKNYKFLEFDSKEVYLEIFFSLYGTRTVGKGFDNFIELFIDPITREVLRDLKYPTDFVDLLLFANSLLEDNAHIRENNMNLYRVRSNEVVNTYLYKVLADAYSVYKNSSNSPNPIKMSVPQDKLLKEIVACPLVQDYSVINPIKEAEEMGQVTYRGPSGLNLVEAYTIDKRSYDESMLGLLAASSPFDSKVGISRQLSYSPRIVSNRGFIKTGDKYDPELDLANLLSPSELLTPFSSSHDDPPRIAMATAQSKHVVPIKKNDKLLIGNGAEKTLPHILGDDFVFRAKQDGVVEAFDEKSQIMIVKYKDGSHDAVDLSPSIGKNSGGGFYISNTKVSSMGEYEKFKGGQILARNENYFKGKGDNIQYATGDLIKLAIHSGYYTHEDASIVTEKLCGELTTYVTMKKERVIGKNTNIDFIVKKGDKIRTGDPLMIFEQSYSEADANQMLQKIAVEYREKITTLAKNSITSKYTGVIEDVKIYYACDESELSPSLKKIIRAYKSSIKMKENILKKYFEDSGIDIILPPTEKVKTKDGKIKGVSIGDGVLIEFYIKYEDELGVGDKVSVYTALKSVIAERIPQELAPYSETRKDEPIDMIMGHVSVTARKTASIYLAMFGNKVLIELKRKVRDLYL